MTLNVFETKKIGSWWKFAKKERNTLHLGRLSRRKFFGTVALILNTDPNVQLKFLFFFPLLDLATGYFTDPIALSCKRLIQSCKHVHFIGKFLLQVGLSWFQEWWILTVKWDCQIVGVLRMINFKLWNGIARFVGVLRLINFNCEMGYFVVLRMMEFQLWNKLVNNSLLRS